jgi:C-terminal processing protease CtpA/Prc
LDILDVVSYDPKMNGLDWRTLKYFTAMFVNRDVKLFDRVERKNSAPEIAKSMHSIYYPGKLIVQVDSESASAEEIFTRVMQLEKRGTVLGDRTSGSVMEATNIAFTSSGVDCGTQSTIANLIMSDSQNLEHGGVDPDEVVLPQPADLASGRDLVLAHAAAQLGLTLARGRCETLPLRVAESVNRR